MALGSQIVLPAGQHAGDNLGAGERTAFVEPVPQKMRPSIGRIARQIRVLRHVNVGIEQATDAQALLRARRIGKPAPLSSEDREMLERAEKAVPLDLVGGLRIGLQVQFAVEPGIRRPVLREAKLYPMTDTGAPPPGAHVLGYVR